MLNSVEYNLFLTDVMINSLLNSTFLAIFFFMCPKFDPMDCLVSDKILEYLYIYAFRI